MATTKWTLDPMHSEIGFKIKHLMITNVTGTFNKFEVTAETNGDDFSTAKVNTKLEVESINTNNAQRDEHLRTADFFDAGKFPFITFKSTKLVKNDDGAYDLHGNLTIRDVVKPVKLALEYTGISKDPWGNTKAGFALTGKINRNEFGITFNAALETGGVMLADELKIFGELQLVKQMELQPA